jgi:hypothetical protein
MRTLRLFSTLGRCYILDSLVIQLCPFRNRTRLGSDTRRIGRPSLYSLPLTFLLQKETPTVRACLGAILAVSGIMVLAFRGTLPEEED